MKRCWKLENMSFRNKAEKIAGSEDGQRGRIDKTMFLSEAIRISKSDTSSGEILTKRINASQESEEAFYLKMRYLW